MVIGGSTVYYVIPERVCGIKYLEVEAEIAGISPDGYYKVDIRGAWVDDMNIPLSDEEVNLIGNYIIGITYEN